MVGNQIGSMVGAAVGGSSGPLAVLGVPTGTAIGGVVGGMAGKVADTVLLSAANGLVQRFARGIGQPPPTIGRPTLSGGLPPRPPPSGELPHPPSPLGGQRLPPPPPPPQLPPPQLPPLPPPPPQQSAASELNSPAPAIPQEESSLTSGGSQVRAPPVDQSFYLRKMFIKTLYMSAKLNTLQNVIPCIKFTLLSLFFGQRETLPMLMLKNTEEYFATN